MARLSLIQKVEIIKAYESGTPSKELAQQYGVTQPAIYYTWKIREVFLRKFEEAEKQEPEAAVSLRRDTQSSASCEKAEEAVLDLCKKTLKKKGDDGVQEKKEKPVKVKKVDKKKEKETSSKFASVEKELLEWYKEASKKEKISKLDVQLKALVIVKDRKLSSDDRYQLVNEKDGLLDGWFKKWKRDYGGGQEKGQPEHVEADEKEKAVQDNEMKEAEDVNTDKKDAGDEVEVEKNNEAEEEEEKEKAEEVVEDEDDMESEGRCEVEVEEESEEAEEEEFVDDYVDEEEDVEEEKLSEEDGEEGEAEEVAEENMVVDEDVEEEEKSEKDLENVETEATAAQRPGPACSGNLKEKKELIGKTVYELYQKNSTMTKLDIQAKARDMALEMDIPPHLLSGGKDWFRRWAQDYKTQFASAPLPVPTTMTTTLHEKKKLVDQRVHEWYLKEKDKNPEIGQSEIQQKAREIAIELKIRTSKFNAGHTWFNVWAQEYKVHPTTTLSVPTTMPLHEKKKLLNKMVHDWYRKNPGSARLEIQQKAREVARELMIPTVNFNAGHHWFSRWALEYKIKFKSARVVVHSNYDKTKRIVGKKVFKWYQGVVAKNLPISKADIKAKIKEVAQKKGISPRVCSGGDKWYEKWRLEYGVEVASRTGGRPQEPEPRPGPFQMRRGRLSVFDKVDIVRRLRRNGSVKSLASEYDVSESAISRVWKDSSKIWNYNRMDQKLYAWYKRHSKVTRPLLEAKAVEIAMKKKLVGFARSVKWWVTQWLGRRNLAVRDGKRGRPRGEATSTPTPSTSTSRAHGQNADPVPGPSSTRASKKAKRVRTAPEPQPGSSTSTSNPRASTSRGNDTVAVRGPSKTYRTAKGELSYDYRDEIEMLLDKRVVDNVVYYLAKYANYDDDQNLWEKEERLDRKLIEEYEQDLVKRETAINTIEELLKHDPEMTPESYCSYFRGCQLERIVSLERMTGGANFFLVKFVGLNEYELVSTKKVAKENPQEYITFFENRLFHEGGRDDGQFVGRGLDLVD